MGLRSGILPSGFGVTRLRGMSGMVCECSISVDFSLDVLSFNCEVILIR